LIQGFQDHLGMGPMAYVKLLRLHGIRRRLLQAEPGEIQIGAMAEAWGFHVFLSYLQRIPSLISFSFDI
jgi:AraC family ethanolamine operon transcriptional activator